MRLALSFLLLQMFNIIYPEVILVHYNSVYQIFIPFATSNLKFDWNFQLKFIISYFPPWFIRNDIYRQLDNCSFVSAP